MCGIVGQYRFDSHEVQTELLRKQIARMKHRGPDSDGIWQNNHVGLGHVRLTIIDLSDQGCQPMISPDKSNVLVYNGEIYNYKQLKNKFEAPYEYLGTSDTEVLRNGLVAKGVEFMKDLEGMFAFAFYDVYKDELIIARDSFGVKPLYYYRDNSKISFASEIKVLLEDPSITASVNYEALKEYFILGYCLDPETAFKDIYKLQPGKFLRISKNGVIEDSFFTMSEYLETNHKNRNDEWLEIFDESIKLHTVSDVPFGSFLSGGLDSNLIIHSLKKQGLIECSFRAYNAGKDGDGSAGVYWERRVAEQSAEYYGVNLTKIDSDEKKFMPIDSVIDIIEEPICNPSNYLIDKICKAAKEGNQKVLLSGHGGDEAFAGYRRHLAAKYLGIIRNFGLGRVLLLLNKIKPNNLLYRIGTAGQGSNKYPILSLVGIALSLTSGKSPLTDWVTKQDLNRIAEKLYSFIPAQENLSFLKQTMYLEFGTYLPSQNLLNMDKFSMQNSVEVRVPFLYRPLVKYGLNSPDSDLIKGNKTKALIRNAGRDLLPTFITKKPKSGFAPSQSDLIRDEQIKSVVLDSSVDQHGLFNKNIIEKEFYGNSNVTETQALQLLNIATIEAWLNKHT